MPKIPELSDAQLVSQLDKFSKTLEQLLRERKSRIAKGVKKENLLTPLEKQKSIFLKSPFDQSKPVPQSVAEKVVEDKTKPIIEKPKEKREDISGSFSFELDPLELEKSIEDAKKNSKKEEEDDQIRVTTLLKLTKEQMDEIKGKK